MFLYLMLSGISIQSCGFYTCPTYSGSDKQYAKSKVVAKSYKRSIKKRGF